jgi:hypothetical protein
MRSNELADTALHIVLKSKLVVRKSSKKRESNRQGLGSDRNRCGLSSEWTGSSSTATTKGKPHEREKIVALAYENGSEGPKFSTSILPPDVIAGWRRIRRHQVSVPDLIRFSGAGAQTCRRADSLGRDTLRCLFVGRFHIYLRLFPANVVQLAESVRNRRVNCLYFTLILRFPARSLQDRAKSSETG